MKLTAETYLIIKREDADGSGTNQFPITDCNYHSVAIGVFSSQIVRCFFASLALFLALLVSSASLRASADDRGTVGIVVRQLFSEMQPNYRGVLAIMHVVEDSPAAKAGIHCSDFIAAVNGVPVPGREFSDIVNKDINGPVGGTVRLTVARFDGSKSEITLVRTPFPPHVNPGSDPFVYVVPGSWGNDPRVPFPLPWASTLPYHGFVDLFFSPNFDQADSPEYHSYVIFMSLEGKQMLSAEQLQSDMVTWYRGLAMERGGAYKFTPDLSKVSVTYKEDSAPSRTFGGTATRAFSGTATIYDTHGKMMTLNSEVRMISGCGASNNTVFFFGMSLEPRDGEVWKQLDAIRDTFRCSR
jgi:membrane-associated protease RseP (regulator of RpoE activity)